MTLVKAAGAASADPAASEAERSRAADLAARLSMPVLARAWQMLLKGYDEVRNAPRPHAAADMVLVSLAYAADLPTPADLVRQLRDGSAVPAAKGCGRDLAPQASSRKPVTCERAEVAGGAEACRATPTKARTPTCRSRPHFRRRAKLRGSRRACRRQARSQAQTCADRAGTARAFPPRPYRAQPAASRADASSARI